MITLSDIQPISISLSEDEKWIERIRAGKEYFASEGIDNIYWVDGIHAEKFGVTASRPYLRDNPEQNWFLEQRTVGGYLSGYMIWNICLSHPEWKYILLLEDDARFIDGWKEKLNQALIDVPEDFDILHLGPCCTEGREQTHIKGDVYEVKYPLCGHAMIIAHKAMRTLIDGCKDACIPMDVHLFDSVYEKLKVYSTLPRLANQIQTEFPD